jgi:hypothetical protein
MVRYIQCCCFSGLDPSLNIPKTKPVRFRNWLCSRLQVKMPVLLSPIEGANPSPRAEEDTNG